MIYPVVEVDNITQVGEIVRINAIKSFKTPDELALTAVKIQPSASDLFYSVGELTDAQTWILDWVYETAGTKTITIRLEIGATIKDITTSLVVKTSTEEKLFCKDVDLIPHEQDIMKWVPAGRSTWNFIFRRAQQRIMNEIDKQRIFDIDGNKLTLDAVMDVSELKDWSIYMSLAMIFQGLSNQKDDVFMDKAIMYEKKQFEYMQFTMNMLRLDYNKDGVMTKADNIGFRSTGVFKR